ncbi:MAG: hypothetical protein K9L85_04430 [Candidatus Peribacteraceae bacterium]|nr:hypothetical protein [Candidatus Peribacteraceae bacterium]
MPEECQINSGADCIGMVDCLNSAKLSEEERTLAMQIIAEDKGLTNTTKQPPRTFLNMLYKKMSSLTEPNQEKNMLAAAKIARWYCARRKFFRVFENK